MFCNYLVIIQLHDRGWWYLHPGHANAHIDVEAHGMAHTESVVKAHTESVVNTLRLRRNEQHFADDIFKRIFFNENVWFSINISLKFVPKGPMNNIPALVQIMAWRRSGYKPLSEPMMVRLPTHICVTRPQWVKVQLACHWSLQFTVLHPFNIIQL